MSLAASPANESDLRVCKDWQPFGLDLETEMATGIEPDPASDSKRETREVEVCATGNMRDSHAGHCERFSPRGQVFHKGFVAEISMKLVKNHALPGRLGRDLFRVNIRILPCPAYFDQVLFRTEAHTKRNSIARARVGYKARVQACGRGLTRKNNNVSIT